MTIVCYIELILIFLSFHLQKRIAPFLQMVFMQIVSTVFTVLNAPTDSRDQVAANERKMLQRGYFSFLGTLVNNNVLEVLSNQGG